MHLSFVLIAIQLTSRPAAALATTYWNIVKGFVIHCVLTASIPTKALGNNEVMKSVCELLS